MIVIYARFMRDRYIGRIHESDLVEDISFKSMMVEEIEKTPVRPKRRNRKALHFTFEK